MSPGVRSCIRHALPRGGAPLPALGSRRHRRLPGAVRTRSRRARDRVDAALRAAARPAAGRRWPCGVADHRRLLATASPFAAPGEPVRWCRRLLPSAVRCASADGRPPYQRNGAWRWRRCSPRWSSRDCWRGAGVAGGGRLWFFLQLLPTRPVAGSTCPATGARSSSQVPSSRRMPRLRVAAALLVLVSGWQRRSRSNCGEVAWETTRAPAGAGSDASAMHGSSRRVDRAAGMPPRAGTRPRHARAQVDRLDAGTASAPPP
jgi:hypothetical protein